MAETPAEPDTAAEANPPKSNSTRTIVRVSVGLILAVLLVAAWLDRRANNNATTTTEKWLAEMKTADDEGRQLTPSDLSEFVVGDPEIVENNDGGIIVYKWNGTFRSYKTSVMCADPDDPIVVGIEGPSL